MVEAFGECELRKTKRGDHRHIHGHIHGRKHQETQPGLTWRDYAEGCYWYGLGVRLWHDKLALHALLGKAEEEEERAAQALLRGDTERERGWSTSTEGSARSWRDGVFGFSVGGRRREVGIKMGRKSEGRDGMGRKRGEGKGGVEVEVLKECIEAVEEVEKTWFEWLTVKWEGGEWKLRFEVNERARVMEREAARAGRIRWSVCSGSGSGKSSVGGSVGPSRRDSEVVN